MQKIIFQISGGLGKHVAATGVIKAIKRQYPDSHLIVVSGFPIVFRHNPHVDVNMNYSEQSYFYERFIDKASPLPIFMLKEPYIESDFVNRINGHLIKIWSEINGVEYKGELPELFISKNELDQSLPLFNAGNGKKIMVVQTNGGPEPQPDPNNPAQPNPHPYSWARDLPTATAQKVVDAFADEYNIFHIRRKDQFALQNTYSVTDRDYRVMACLIAQSDKRLLIDSFAQHTAAALRKPSVVCWIANTPAQFGYELHQNILANAETLKPDLRTAVYQKYNILGLDGECPYNSQEDIFDADRIIEAIATLSEKSEPAVKSKVKA
jgi:hypothetical protein